MADGGSSSSGEATFGVLFVAMGCMYVEFSLWTILNGTFHEGGRVSRPSFPRSHKDRSHVHA